MVKTITVDELRRDLKKLHVVDVREADEYQQGHIEGAVNITLGRLIRDSGTGIVPRDREVVVHCRSGGRAQIACEFLEKIGYTNVKNLVGGFMAWEQAVRKK